MSVDFSRNWGETEHLRGWYDYYELGMFYALRDSEAV